MVCRGLLLVLGVNTDGDWPVINEFYLHLSAELACTYGFTYCLAQSGAERIIERNRDFVAACTEPRRAVAFLVGGVERELADDQRLALDVEYGAVHHALVVVENAEVADLLYQPCQVVVGIKVFYAQKDEQTLADGRLFAAADGDTGAANALYDCSHDGWFFTLFDAKIKEKNVTTKLSGIFLMEMLVDDLGFLATNNLAKCLGIREFDSFNALKMLQ